MQHALDGVLQAAVSALQAEERGDLISSWESYQQVQFMPFLLEYFPAHRSIVAVPTRQAVCARAR